MAISDFPTALQPIIQQNFLEREFQDSLESLLGYRSICDRELFPNGIGETVTKTRAGLKAPVTTPMNPSANTNLDNGLTPASWTVEQYTLGINMYGDTIDLNIITQRVGIASQFLQNAKVNGIQAAQTLDRLARNQLFNNYLGGNTRVSNTLGSAGATINVDDIRGFLNVPVNGVMTAVSGGNTAQVFVGSSVYTLIGVAAAGSNTSTSPMGISGSLTFSTNVTVPDGTLNNPVVHANAPSMFRPNGRSTTNSLISSDILTMSLLLDAQAQLRNNAPLIAEPMRFFADNKSMRQLFADPDFKLLYQGQYGSEAFREGRIFNLLGIDFIPTTEAFTQSLNGLTIRRPILTVQGALIEGDFEGTGTQVKGDEAHEVSVIDTVAQVVRPPLDRLAQIIAQSWYWIGGFCCPTDVTANQNIIPTASAAYLKRAVILETA